MNDFSNEGGGTIRMQGVLNELSKKGHEVIFISNTQKHQLFEDKIQHIFIDFLFSRRDKRIFQGLLVILPMFLIKTKYSKLLDRLNEIFKNKFDNEPIYFFEYLDNSIGYCLKSNKSIKSYINDIHGIATSEFKFQAANALSIKEKIIFNIKYKLSYQLDKKVFNHADGFIFASNAMKNHFSELYPKVIEKKCYVLPNLLSSNFDKDEIDFNLKNELLNKYQIKKSEKIFFFAGGLKKTGGVPDLIAAFSKIVNQYETRLIIVGDGPNMNECLQTVATLNLSKKVIFVGRIPYSQLRTYQDLASIIVCPDKQNDFSELIVHVKYFDSLISGKIVINGSFKSVKEINVNESLSIDFKPSDIESLSSALQFAIDNFEELNSKYKNNITYTVQNLTYSSFVSVLEIK